MDAGMLPFLLPSLADVLSLHIPFHTLCHPRFLTSGNLWLCFVFCCFPGELEEHHPFVVARRGPQPLLQQDWRC